jgi:hypothetical protein
VSVKLHFQHTASFSKGKKAKEEEKHVRAEKTKNRKKGNDWRKQKQSAQGGIYLDSRENFVYEGLHIGRVPSQLRASLLNHALHLLQVLRHQRRFVRSEIRANFVIHCNLQEQAHKERTENEAGNARKKAPNRKNTIPLSLAGQFEFEMSQNARTMTTRALEQRIRNPRDAWSPEANCNEKARNASKHKNQ